jgi:hypothetical protein
VRNVLGEAAEEDEEDGDGAEAGTVAFIVPCALSMGVMGSREAYSLCPSNAGHRSCRRTAEKLRRAAV